MEKEKSRQAPGNPEAAEKDAGAPAGGRQAAESRDERATHLPEGREVALRPDEPVGDEPGGVYPSTTRDTEPRPCGSEPRSAAR